MHRSHRSVLLYLSLGIAFSVACGAEPIEVPGDDGDDDRGGTGTGATSGVGGYGGAVTGGAFNGGTASGGTPATGGFSGTPATGGTLATGGTFPTGGTPATGGTLATGGTFPTGGTPATGGTLATGGTAGTPGGAGTGNTTTTCDAAFAAGADGFIRAPGLGGCWHGYAYSGGDTGSMLTTMTSFAMCGMPCALRAAGTLGAATAANSYAGVVYLGFNINQPAGSSTFTPIAPTGTSLQVTYTKVSGPATIRVQIQAGANRWCANLPATSPATIAYTMFNTTCWDTTMGTAYAKQPIEAVQLVAPGEMAAMPIDMTLVSVKDM